MLDPKSFAPAFASPHAGDSSELVSALALGRLRNTRLRIATSLADRGLTETAESVLAFTPGDGSAWRPELGLALQAHEKSLPGLAALQLAAACAGMGGNGRLECRLEAPAWLYLDGWLAAVGGRCKIDSDESSIRVQSDLQNVEYFAQGHRWAPATQSFGPWTAHPSGGLAPRYFTVTGLRNSAESFPWISTEPAPRNAAMDARGGRETGDACTAIINRGWQLIVEQAPIYSSWVATTAAGCLLLDRNQSSASQSGSSFEHPGLIAMDPPTCPCFCGEVLVHECSHQQLMIYEMIAPMVVPGSDEMAYSPIKRANRPIARVLTGAHAVGNMILYYSALSRSMELNARSKERFGQHRKWFIEEYRPALDRSQTLSEEGRALWNSLSMQFDRCIQ